MTIIVIRNFFQGGDDTDSIHHIKIKSGTQNITNFVANNSGLKDELGSYGIHNSTEFPVSSEIKKYDIIKVDTKSLKEQLKSGKEITISLKGKEYPIKLSRAPSVIAVNPEDDAGIDSYHGSLKGIDSNVMFSVSEKYISGSVSLGGETYYIDFVSIKKGSELSDKLIESPLHIIYAEKDLDFPDTPIDSQPNFSFADLKQLEEIERSSGNSSHRVSDTNQTVSPERQFTFPSTAPLPTSPHS